ncbi:hypothetical protein M0805_000645 [Coniferiporia weirii]|nr:hypothetical protein M0805_000645 [Coniferiporia weirii]
MSTVARLHSLRPFFAASSTQCICRRALFGDTVHSAPSRSRLLYTTRPLRATLVTSASNTLPSTAAFPAESAFQASASSIGATASQSSTARPASSRLSQGIVCELLRAPTQADIDDAEVDAELLSSEEACILLTERAAEQLRSIATREGDPNAALRISVDSGGCHGYQYKMDVESECQPDDYHFSHPTIKPSNVFVDAVSLPLLKNSTLDYATELIGSSFRVSDNPQAKAGCGCGVSWELKL